MSVTVDHPVDFPALFRSANRESQRAQRSYLVSFKLRMGALLVAAFGGATDSNVGDVIAFVAFACALGAEPFPRHDGPAQDLVRGTGRRRVGQNARLAIHGLRQAL
jgi:SMODS and SLOG-associating 2TM effector domain 3